MMNDGKLERKDEHPINPVEKENRITPHVKLKFSFRCRVLLWFCKHNIDKAKKITAIII